jgi:hypothetical protein
MRPGRTLRTGGFAALIAVMASASAFAQGTGTVQPGALGPDPTSGDPGKGYHCCNNNTAPLTSDQVSAYEGAMNSLLNQAGGQLTTTIRNLMLSDSDALSLILALAHSPQATPEQQAAIASGLGQAAQMWTASNQGPPQANPLTPTLGQSVGTAIQQKVASSALGTSFITAYSTAAGGNPIGAAGGGGGGSAGGPGGQTNALSNGFFGTGAAQTIGGSGVNTGPFTMTGGVVGAGSTTTSTTTSP